MGKKLKTEEGILDLLTDFIDSLPKEEKPYFAKDVCFMAALYGGDTDIESIGVIECARHELNKEFDRQLNEMIADEIKKEIEDSVKEEIAKDNK